MNNGTLPPCGPEIESVSEAELDAMSSILNCERSLLRDVDCSIKENIIAMNSMSKSEILSRLAEIGNKSLFKMFVDLNMPFLLSEATTSREFHTIIFNCIKIDSTKSFTSIMSNAKFSLNGPQAIVAACMNGSRRILQFMMRQKDDSQYSWEWKNFDGGSGYMLDFGRDPLSAALFLGTLNAISEGHLECLMILVANGVNISFKDYMLIKNAASVQGTEPFKILHCDVTVPDSAINEVLLLAIKNNNDSLVEYLLSLHYAYQVTVQSHLVYAINSNNDRLFDFIFERVNHEQLTIVILSQAASVGNAYILISLLKVSSKELVVSALCSFIANESLQHFVPIIASNIILNSDIVSKALLHSVKASSLPMVKIFLNAETCNPSIATASFIEALMMDNAEILNEFFGKFVHLELLPQNRVSKTLSKLIEIKAWNSLKLFVKYYFSSDGFPKVKFISKIILTDQVEIANIAAKNGAKFPQSELFNIHDKNMRVFVMSMISKDFIKSQSEKVR